PCSMLLCSSQLRRVPASTLFPYTTLFRSRLVIHHAGVGPLPPDTRGHEPECGDVEGAVTGPLPRLTGGAGDHVVIHPDDPVHRRDRKSTRLNSSHLGISYAVFCLKKKKTQ